MKMSQLILTVVIGGVVAAHSGYALACGHDEHNVTPEMRQKMATMHEKMATCLRSEKAMGECRSEMMGMHKDMMGKDDKCPMEMPMMGKTAMGGKGPKAGKGAKGHHHEGHGDQEQMSCGGDGKDKDMKCDK
jgi:hypothetical protein